MRPKSFEYFSISCGVSSKTERLIYSLPGYYICDFHPEGLVIASNPFSGELKLIDKNDVTLWSDRTAFAHHELIFTKDKKGFLTITSELVTFQNSIVRSDCVSKRDLNNKIVHEWCLKDHIEQLVKLGFKFKKKLFSKAAQFVGPDSEYEISHANSIDVIGPNSRSKSDPAFAEGNYLVNFYTPSMAVIILDKKMEKILWHKNMGKFRYGSNSYSVFGHDYQVTSDGHILAYFNKMKPSRKLYADSFANLFNINLGILYFYPVVPSFFSVLVEFDPYTDEIYWIYGDDPSEVFKADVNGVVLKFKDSFLYSDIPAGGRATERTFDGKKIWTFIPKIIDPKTQKPTLLIDFKPMPNDDFLKAHNL